MACHGPYLDARTDRISPHTSLALAASLSHPPASPKRSSCKDFYERRSQSLDQSSMVCRQVVDSNCLLCDVIYPILPRLHYARSTLGFFFFYWGLTPQQQPGSYQGGEMMMKSVFWWRKPEYPEETTDLRQVTVKSSHIGPLPSLGIEFGPQRCEAK